MKETADRLVVATLIKGGKLSDSLSYVFDLDTKQWYCLDPSANSNESVISKLSTMESTYYSTS